MNRHEELLPASLKSIKATRLHHALLKVEEAFNDICIYCGGLPSGLAFQIYTELEECKCPYEQTDLEFFKSHGIRR